MPPATSTSANRRGQPLEVHFLAATPEPVRTDRGLTVLPTATPADLPDPDLVVFDGSRVSGAGVDMALALTERVHGRALAEALQLLIEYDPQPPFDSGSPAKASARTLRLRSASSSETGRFRRRRG